MTSISASFSGSSIRSRLIVLMMVAFLPMVVMSTIFVCQGYRASGDNAKRSVLLARSAFKARIDASLEQFQRLLAALGHSPDVAASFDACHKILNEVLVFDEALVQSLAVVDHHGAIRCAAGEAVPGLFDKADRLWPHMRNGGLIVTAPPLGGNNAAKLFIVRAFPFVNLPDVAVVGGMQVTNLLEAPRQDGNVAHAWLITARGRVVSMTGSDPGLLPKPATLAAVQKTETATHVQQSVNHQEMVYASASISGGLHLLVGYQVADKFGATTTLLRLAAIMTALVILGLFAVLLGARKAIVLPLRQLGQAVSEWRKTGMFDEHIAFAPREVRELAHSFQEATLSLMDQEMQLRGATAQQELLMQEIHHRVKNNLQIVASLLNLQAARIRQPAARAEFQSARDRVRALATLHRHLYSHGEVHTINMRSFLVELCGQLFQAMGETPGDRIELSITASELQMSSDQAVPLALIVTEAVSNAVKYAFPGGRHGCISLSLAATEQEAILVIQDDGIGIPAGRAETETGPRDGLGLQLIRGFARQLAARLTIEEGTGTRYQINITLHRNRENAAVPEPV